MPRRLPLYVERNNVKGHTYLSFRKGKGVRIRLPDDPTTEEFRTAYHAAMVGAPLRSERQKITQRKPYSIAALIASYKQSAEYKHLREKTSKPQYDMRLGLIERDHGHRCVKGLSPKRIRLVILQPLADRPGAALDTLKKIRVLIRHAIHIEWLEHDPSIGIKRPRGNEIRAWHDHELDAFEAKWPLGSKQRTAYAIQLYMGTARVDTHLLTWPQVEKSHYERSKTGVAVQTAIAKNLKAALDEWPRTHVTLINTAYGKPFTVDGYSRFMRDAIWRPGCHWTASRTDFAKRWGACWLMLVPRRMRSWPCSATRRLPKRSATRAMPTVGAAERLQSPSWTVSASGLPKPQLRVWGNRQKRKENQSDEF